MKFRPFALTAHSVLPAYPLAMGTTLLCLFSIVVLPLAVLVLSVTQLTWVEIMRVATDARVLASFRVSIMAAVGSAMIAGILGIVIAWVLVRYEFAGRGFLNALIDLPFALPTAIAGIALCAVYAPDGWVGGYLQSIGIELVFNQAGIWLALIFVGLPYVVRALEPVLEALDSEIEEAALSLGATHGQMFLRVLLPHLFPALVSGFSLALARGFGEFGSVIFLSSNIPQVAEIVPLVILVKLEEYDMAGAHVIAVMMLMVSFAVLYGLNSVQQWKVSRVV
ncbi:MAG: sulfate ABC transporter permease subunit CysT [Alphaproteobacteria bacterium]|nr:sulfate ABC transporter permease subunit CysT [Alphaproteobacteria bacterium]